MILERITPVVLTLNEELNIGRTLDSLAAFARVVVVDSGSSDRTEAIARAHPNVAWYERDWRGFGEQWSFAFRETAISTPFILALDADMSAPPDLVKELEEIAGRGDVNGGVIGFEYRIQGVPLAGSLYPAQLRLLRAGNARVGEVGHAHLLEVDGRAVKLRNRLVHDDRKPLEAFVRAQLGYSTRELSGLLEGKGGPFSSRVRRAVPFTPIAVWAWAWLLAGGPFRGPAARRYALERLLYEAMLRWRMEDRLLAEAIKSGVGPDGPPGREVSLPIAGRANAEAPYAPGSGPRKTNGPSLGEE